MAAAGDVNFVQTTQNVGTGATVTIDLQPTGDNMGKFYYAHIETSAGKDGDVSISFIGQTGSLVLQLDTGIDAVVTYGDITDDTKPRDGLILDNSNFIRLSMKNNEAGAEDFGVKYYWIEV